MPTTDANSVVAASEVSGSAPIVVFDGICRLCSGWVQFLLRHDRSGRVRFAPMQGRVGRALLQEQGLDPDDPLSFLWVEAGRGYRDSDAILRIFRALGFPWRLLYLLRVIPRRWRDAAYRRIARNRYRWFGRREHCLLPDAAVAARFLD